MNKEKNQNLGVDLLEVKKSEKANLEQNRTTWLLLGFIFALGVLFAGLEITEFQDAEEKPVARTKAKDDIIVVVELQVIGCQTIEVHIVAHAEVSISGQVLFFLSVDTIGLLGRAAKAHEGKGIVGV